MIGGPTGQSAVDGDSGVMASGPRDREKRGREGNRWGRNGDGNAVVFCRISGTPRGG